MAAAACLSRPTTRPPAIGGVETRQPAPAPADGAAIALVGFRSGRRAARCRAAGARRRQPAAVAQLQDLARYRIPRYGGDAADRPYALDPPAADPDPGAPGDYCPPHAPQRWGQAPD